MGMSKKIIPATAYGVAFGGLGYVLGAAGHAVLSSITATAMGIIFFAAAVAVGLSE